MSAIVSRRKGHENITSLEAASTFIKAGRVKTGRCHARFVSLRSNQSSPSLTHALFFVHSRWKLKLRAPTSLCWEPQWTRKNDFAAYATKLVTSLSNPIRRAGHQSNMRHSALQNHVFVICGVFYSLLPECIDERSTSLGTQARSSMAWRRRRLEPVQLLPYLLFQTKEHTR